MTDERFEMFADQVNEQFNYMHEEFAKVNGKIDCLEKEHKEEFAKLNSKIDCLEKEHKEEFAKLNSKIDYLGRDHEELKTVTGIIAKDLTGKLKESKKDRKIIHKEIDEIKKVIGIA